METKLLQSKLLAPPLRADVVARARLLSHFNINDTLKLILVSAPAGFGKTTAVNDCLVKNEAINTAWISLDSDDNDEKRFLQQFVTAIAAKTSIGEDSLAVLEAAQSLEADEVLAPLLNEATTLDKAICIILDDYHLINNERIHEAINFLLEYAPPSIKLCIISRSDPPLKLAQLRINAQLSELRGNDLRFSAEETANFLTNTTNLELPPELSKELSQRAEGWAVGLQVMALSLSSMTEGSDQERFLKDLNSNNRFLLDYMLDEVLVRQTEEVQSFLLKTSLVDSFNTSLCEAILSPDDISCSPSDMIELLEKANLFISPLDSDRQWFRYHQLFKDVLAHRFATLHPSELQTLRQSAALWYEQNGEYTEALQQLLKANSLDAAAELISRIGPVLIWKLGDASSLTSYLAKLPSELYTTHPDLYLLKAWVCHVTGDIEAVEPLLDEADTILAFHDTEDTQQLQAESTALRSFVKRMLGELEEAQTLSQQALESLPESDYQLLSLVNGNLGEIHYLKGDLKQADHYHKEESRLAEKAGSVLPSRYALWRVADIQTIEGKLERAKKTSMMMLNLNKAKHINALGFADIQLGIIALERNQLEEAEKRLATGIDLGKRLMNPRIFFPGYGPLAQTLVALNRADEAQEVLDEAKQLAAEHNISWTWGIPPIDAHQALLDVATGNSDKAYSWAEQQGFTSKMTTLDFQQEFSVLAAAKILLEKSHYAKALDLLDVLEKQSQTAGRLGSASHIGILKSIALTELSSGKALEVLEETVAQASEEGYVRAFLDAGETAYYLLSQLKQADKQVPYCSFLLGQFPADMQIPAKNIEAKNIEARNLEANTPTTANTSVANKTTSNPIIVNDIVNELDEELNERELTVLRLMSARLSNKEIAKELDLSTNTIKWYAKSIFEKLNVHGRIKAGEKARALGLV